MFLFKTTYFDEGNLGNYSKLGCLLSSSTVILKGLLPRFRKIKSHLYLGNTTSYRHNRYNTSFKLTVSCFPSLRVSVDTLMTPPSLCAAVTFVFVLKVSPCLCKYKVLDFAFRINNSFGTYKVC